MPFVGFDGGGGGGADCVFSPLDELSPLKTKWLSSFIKHHFSVWLVGGIGGVLLAVVKPNSSISLCVGSIGGIGIEGVLPSVRILLAINTCLLFC